MLFDLAAWAVILVLVSAIGGGAIALLAPDDIRSGDRFIIATWTGVVVLSSGLLTASLVSPLTPVVAASVALALAALGIGTARWRGWTSFRILYEVAVPRWATAVGVGALLIGAAAFASDPVTLYDSLVYHIGVIHWLREQGTVPGIALIHNRLGHVSSWFTLAAAFEFGPAFRRAANVPLGFALVVVGLQAAIATTRIALRSARLSDWFLLATSAALIWAGSAQGAATPSPDVAANVLIVVAAWSMLVASPAEGSPQRDSTRLIPVLLALGACAMKLFAVPALAAAAVFYLSAPVTPPLGAVHVRRVSLAAATSIAILGPFVAANLVASGCPAYPSPVGCLDAPWSVGPSQAADYAVYVRDVARWERRGVTSVGASLGWVVPWIIAHPVVASLTVLSPPVGLHLLRRMRVHGAGRAAQAIVMLAILGIGFAAWAAPASRFLFSFVVAVPALTFAVIADERVHTRGKTSFSGTHRAGMAFVCACVLAGFSYALASQKLNVRSALGSGAPLVRLTDLVVPAQPEVPSRLFKWRVNDIDVYTPVPRPVADSLGYHSVIAFNASFEKCSTAPLPCTPYLPERDVQLRRPAIGLRAGFARMATPNLGSRTADCVLELHPAGSSAASFDSRAPGDPAAPCRVVR